MVVWEPRFGALSATERGFSPFASARRWAGSRPRAASSCIRLCFSESKISTNHLRDVPLPDSASLRSGFAAAANFRPGTASAVMTPSFFSSRTTSFTCFCNHHSGLTATWRSCHRLGAARQPTDDPVAQWPEVWLPLDQELLIRIVGAANHESASR